MREFRLRNDVERVVVNGFAYPLGLEPLTQVIPNQGYAVSFSQSDDDAPDTYSFQIVVSHEKVRPILSRLWDLLPDTVDAILEATSYDAYRAIDVYQSAEPLDRNEFLEVWRRYEPFLLEDGSVGAGAKGEEPFTEIFLDQWKSIFVHVEPSRRDEVEHILEACGLNECAEIWPEQLDESEDGEADVRNVLETDGDDSLEFDEFLLALRISWELLLDVDIETNIDEAGRPLGLTLWNTIFLADSILDEKRGAYVSIWATAGSISELYDLIDAELESTDWRRADEFSLERRAYDTRPDELADLPPRPEGPAIHQTHVEPWETDIESV